MCCNKWGGGKSYKTVADVILYKEVHKLLCYFRTTVYCHNWPANNLIPRPGLWQWHHIPCISAGDCAISFTSIDGCASFLHQNKVQDGRVATTVPYHPKGARLPVFSAHVCVYMPAVGCCCGSVPMLVTHACLQCAMATFVVCLHTHVHAHMNACQRNI